MTNQDFAEAVGVHYTMASRLRGGHRLPSVKVMRRIAEAYNLSFDDLMAAHKLGAPAFGAFLRENVPIEENAVA